MNVLHLLVSGDTGGIEVLCKEIYLNSEHNNSFCFIYKGGKIAEEMKELNAPIYMLDKISKKNILKVLLTAEKLVNENNIERIVIHHSAPISWIIGYYLNIKLSIPYYIYVHGNLFDELRMNEKLKFIRKFIYKRACEKAKGVIAISESVSNSIIKYYPNIKKKITTIYNGINLANFDKSSGEYNINKIPTILFIGRLIPQKGVNLLIEAISKIDDKLKCYIIGDGLERKALERLSVELGVKDRVEFLGIKRNISEWHKKSDIFVHPAICEEGFGITIVESMASGLPCIAFNKGAIPEIIEDKISGFIIKENSVNGLIDVLQNTISIMNTNPNKWKEIKESARFRSQKFDINCMIAQLDGLLLEE